MIVGSAIKHIKTNKQNQDKSKQKPEDKFTILKIGMITLEYPEQAWTERRIQM